MLGLKKRKKGSDGKMVWMIKKNDTNMYLGVCKKDLVHLKDPTACFRFSDIDAAGVFMYWLQQIEKIKEGQYKAVYVRLEEQHEKA